MGTRTSSRAHVEPPSPLTARSIPVDLDVPAAVRAATDRVHAAERRKAEVAGQLRAATAEAREAPRVDRAAAVAAEREGLAIPEPTAPNLEARVEQLKRELGATTDALKAASREQDAAVASVRDEWHAQALGDVDALLGEVGELLDRLAGLHDELEVRGAVVAALDAFQGSFIVQWPTPGVGERARADALARLDGQLVRGRSVKFDAAELLAALELLERGARGAAGRPPARQYRRATFGSADEAAGRAAIATTLEIETRHRG